MCCLQTALGKGFEDNYSKLGRGVKTRFMDTEIKVGDVFPVSPVVQYGDARLLPDTFFEVSPWSTAAVKDSSLQGRSPPTR